MILVCTGVHLIQFIIFFRLFLTIILNFLLFTYILETACTEHRNVIFFKFFSTIWRHLSPRFQKSKIFHSACFSFLKNSKKLLGALIIFQNSITRNPKYLKTSTGSQKTPRDLFYKKLLTCSSYNSINWRNN